MRSISYEKLMSFIRNNPLYEIRETNEVIDIMFHAPSEEEAAGTEITGDEPRPVMVIRFIKNGNELIPKEAWIESGDVKRKMSIEQLDTWLDFIDMYS